MTPKVVRFLNSNDLATPCLVVDLEVIERSLRDFRTLLPNAALYYAVKANPAPAILDVLSAAGAGFDAAGISEIERCLAGGSPPHLISYSNTIKKQADIARAYALGVRLFAFDSEEELVKIAEAAPGSQVLCRLAMDGCGARFPLDKKFGCAPRTACKLLLMAPTLGLEARGLSFHVGSQQCALEPWNLAISRAAGIFHDLSAAGLDLRTLNLGGGFPVRYRSEAPPLEQVCDTINWSLTRHFGNRMPEIAIEPGRAMVATAGVIRTEVVLISRRDPDAPERWVYLDIGRYGGLDETAGDAIEYALRTPADGQETGPVILAGPTCDSIDVMYPNAGYRLPLSLRAGDRIDVLAAGAYTTTTATAGFNGFAPVEQHYI